jgi:hypothetical protein
MNTHTPQQRKAEHAQYSRMTNDQLIAEYKDLIKHGFNSVFGGAAKSSNCIVISILHDRGVYSYNDLLGEVKITAPKS